MFINGETNLNGPFLIFVRKKPIRSELNHIGINIFQNIGFIYNFDHSKTDYIPPGSIEVSINDIESFISDQIIDDQFKTDFTVYYEDIDFTNSNFKKNHYAYPIEEVILNLDFVRSYLQDWHHA